MALYTSNIFIHSELSPEELLVWVKSILGITFLPLTGQEKTLDPELVFAKYSDATSPLSLNIGFHYFDEDRQMDFPSYRYDIEVRLHGDEYSLERRSLTLQFGKQIFDKLKTTRRYRLMLTQEVQVLVEKYDPASDGSAS